MIQADTSYLNPFSFAAHWHLCYYLPHKRKEDPHSKYILEFKETSESPIVSCWCAWAAFEIKRMNKPIDLVIRALSSRELQATKGNAMDVLATTISIKLNIPYQSQLIKKSRTTVKMSLTNSREERQNEIEDVYRLADDCPDLSGKTLLLIDDVATSYTTSGAILKVLKEKYPTCTVYLFTLAKTKRVDDVNSGISLEQFAMFEQLNSMKLF